MNDNKGTTYGDKIWMVDGSYFYPVYEPVMGDTCIFQCVLSVKAAGNMAIAEIWKASKFHRCRRYGFTFSWGILLVVFGC